MKPRLLPSSVDVIMQLQCVCFLSILYLSHFPLSSSRLRLEQFAHSVSELEANCAERSARHKSDGETCSLVSPSSGLRSY